MNTTSFPAAQQALDLSQVRGAMVPVACEDLVANLDFFVQRLGFRIIAIFPADAPANAILQGHGLTLHLNTGPGTSPDAIQLLCGDPDAVAGGVRELHAPNGMAVRFVHADPPMLAPQTRQQLVFTPSGADAHWSVGRAGLRYRDLLPERHGGAFIASHIRILTGGPVPDYTHFHKVRFQVIYCRKGWVRVAYEGLAEPIVMQAGDCVLQPPLIRHRVMESSAGAEVVELASPAQHITMADHHMPLPGPVLSPDHDFNGQRFVFNVARQTPWTPWRVPGFEARDTGIAHATDGLGAVRVLRPVSGQAAPTQMHDTELCFYFVLQGQVTLTVNGQHHVLGADDCVTLPGGLPYGMSASEDAQLLEIMLPADAPGLIVGH